MKIGPFYYELTNQGGLFDREVTFLAAADVTVLSQTNRLTLGRSCTN
jgi:hypothetical protein